MMVAKQASNLLMIATAFFIVSCAGKNQPSKPTPTPALNMTKSITSPQFTSTLQVDNNQGLLTYRGETGYTGVRQYEIDYDSAQWQLIEDFDANPLTPHDERLQNQQDPTCTIGLFNGPIGGRIYIENVELDGWLWELAPQTYISDRGVPTKVSLVVYSTRVNDPIAHEIAYFLTVYVPAPYEPPTKSSCQQQAEQVIATFRLIDSIRQP